MAIWGTAVAVFAAALLGCAGQPASQTAARNLATAGKLKAACQMARQLLDEAPPATRLDPLRFWIDCMSRRGRLDQVSAWLGQQSGPTEAILYGRAMLAIAESPAGLPRALDLLRRAERVRPTEAEIPYRAGILLLADEQAARAEPVLRRACSLSPTAECSVALAHALLDLGRKDEALAEVRLVVERDPRPADIKRGQAVIGRLLRREQPMPRELQQPFRALLSSKHPGAVLDRLRSLVAEHPRVAPLQTLLGLAYLDLDRPAEALGAFRRAEELSPLDARNALQIGLIYRSRGQLRRAEEAFKSALRTNPFVARAALELGLVLLARKAHSEAAQAFRQLVAIEPSDRSLRLAARTCQVADLPKQATPYLERLLRLRPTDFEGNLRLAQVLISRAADGDPRRRELLERARVHAQKAAAASPTAEEPRRALQQIAKRLGEG